MPTFGKTDIGANWGGIGQSGLLFSRYQLTEDGDVTKITAYVRSTNPPENMKCCIYGDKAGPDPDDLKGTTTETSVSSAGWYDFTFSSPVSLTAGYYWLAVFLNSVTCRGQWDSGGTDGGWKGYTYNGAPNPMGAYTNWDNSLSIYATYTPAGATHTKTWTTDALFKKLGIPKTLSVDTDFQKQDIPKTFRIDADFLKRDIIKSFAMDAHFGAVEAETYAKTFALDIIFAYKVRLPELWLTEEGKIVLNISKPYTWVGS